MYLPKLTAVPTLFATILIFAFKYTVHSCNSERCLRTPRNRNEKHIMQHVRTGRKELLLAIRALAKVVENIVPGSKSAGDISEVLIGVYLGTFRNKGRSRRSSKTKNPAGSRGPSLGCKAGNGDLPMAIDEDRCVDLEAGGSIDTMTSRGYHNEDSTNEGKPVRARDWREDPLKSRPFSDTVERNEVMARPKETHPMKDVAALVQALQ